MHGSLERDKTIKFITESTIITKWTVIKYELELVKFGRLQKIHKVSVMLEFFFMKNP